jgi:hypothetical protein
MKTIANAIKLQFNESSKPEIVLSLTCNRQEIATDIQELKDIVSKGKLLAVEIKQHRQKRSLDANAYCWVLCQKIAEVIRSTKEEVYKKAIREVGQFEMLAIQEDAAEQFIKVWNSRGLGWYAEETDSKIKGCKKIMAYYGSSCYDTKAMSVLIDYIVQEAQELDIETMTKEEVESLKQQWCT